MSASLGVQYSFSQLLDFTSTSFRLKSSNAQLEDQEISMREASINTDRQARQAVLDLQAAYRQLAFTRRLLEGIRLQVQVANDQLGANLISYFNHQQVMDGASAAERDLLNQQLNVLNRTIALDLLLGNRPGG
jgi:outer membrane protein TolC